MKTVDLDKVSKQTISRVQALIANASRRDAPVEARRMVRIGELATLLKWPYARTLYTIKKLNKRADGALLTDIGTENQPLWMVSLDALEKHAPTVLGKRGQRSDSEGEVDILRERVMKLEKQVARLLAERPEVKEDAWKSGWASPAQMAELLGVTRKVVGTAITALRLRRDVPGMCVAAPLVSGRRMLGYRYSEKAFSEIRAYIEGLE